MARYRIFVDFAVTGKALELLREGTTGHELVFPDKPASSVLAKAEVDSKFATAEVAFGQPDPGAIAAACDLKWIHLSSSGFARYDNRAFRNLVESRGIAVSNSASVYDESCAIHALAFLLAHSRRLPQALESRAVHGSDEWHELRNSCTPLRSQTILILGFGAIGRRLVELLRPLGMEVLAFRRKARGDEGVPVVTEAQLPAALGAADHVMNILPESSETRNFFDAARFSETKPGAVFYNIGRGTTVDQDALTKALRAGPLQAAWLDVTDPEPLPPSHPLWAEPNCFITPHIAGGHSGETITLVRHFLRNFSRFVSEEPLANRIM